MTPGRLLLRLEATRFDYGRDASARKVALLGQLRRVQLRNQDQVLRFHEHLCFLRANPDDQKVLAAVASLLTSFATRSDLRSLREPLADSGVAGTDIYYRFFWPTARWLTSRWPDQLFIDWDELEDEEPLAAALPLLVGPVEAIWLRTLKPRPREALARLAGNGTDAAFFVKAVERIPGDDFTRERLYDSIALPLILRAGSTTPSRTRASIRVPKTYFRAEAPLKARPDLWKEIEKPPRSTRFVSWKEGSALIDLAREAMVTRGRDLDTFAYGDPGDVRLIDDGDGLAWAMIGLVPERRPLLRTAYGYLTLRNGVPIGYVQSDALWRSVDLAFNMFPTFRGREAALVLGRTMAMLRHIFGATSFTLEPYQLGDGNEEGIESGAWWFYYRLGFRPRNRAIRALVKSELERLERDPDHRSSRATLAQLAKDYLYLDRPADRAPTWPRLAALGYKIAGDPESSTQSDLGPLDRIARPLVRTASAAERNAFTSWAPVLRQMPGITHWTQTEKRELIKIILAKGGGRDSDYLRLFNRHSQLGSALARLVRA
jgi:hypothetical protein